MGGRSWRPGVVLALIGALALALAGVGVGARRAVASDALGDQLGALVAQYEAQGVDQAGVVVRDSASGYRTAVAADRVFPSASLYKLYVLWQTQRAIHAGLIGDDTPIELTAQNDDSADDGYALGPYGSTFTVAELRRLMITQSNNTAAWALAYTIGWGAVDATLADHGFAQSHIAGEQVTSPADVTRFFQGVVDRNLDGTLDADDYALMLDLLQAQELNDLLSPGFPPDAVFAHKTGDLDGVTNDAGVLLLPDNRHVYVSVLTTGDPGAGAALMQDIARLVWRDLVEQTPPSSPSPTPPPPPPPTPTPRPTQVYFPETGHTVAGAFLAYWEDRGGLAQFGYPLTDQRQERLEDGRTYTVQWFERARFEAHPENPPPYDVELGQFGRRILEERTGEAVSPPAKPRPGQAFFPETGHNLGGDFLAYWQANGGLAQFGYPLSEVFQQQLDDGKIYTVQYFERARFEEHPENPTHWTIELGQFGRHILAEGHGQDGGGGVAPAGESAGGRR
ncbi:MAG TPA: serine hydrolase [Thermomicrobiales bacterium]|nr:serine hydrolase [Thermomicrobiales bacterium]